MKPTFPDHLLGASGPMEEPKKKTKRSNTGWEGVRGATASKREIWGVG